MRIVPLFFLLACAPKTVDTSTAEPESQAQPETQAQPESQTQPESQPTDPVGDPSAGESIVNQRCMGCHESNPAIENSANLSDAQLTTLFQNGQNYMPAQDLTEQEILDVIAYLRQTYGGG